MSKKPNHLTDNVMLELSKISALVSVAKPYVDSLDAGEQKTALTKVTADLATAQHEAFTAVCAIRRAIQAI